MSLIALLLAGCAPTPEQSPTEKKLNPKDVEASLKRQGYQPKTTGQPELQRENSDKPFPYFPNMTIVREQRTAEYYDYDNVFATPGLANDRYEITQVRTGYEYNFETKRTWTVYVEPAPQPAPQTPSPQVPVPQSPSPQVPVPQTPGGNSDYDGFLLNAFPLWSSPAEAASYTEVIVIGGVSYTTTVDERVYGPSYKTELGIDFYAKGANGEKSFCTAEVTRNNTPEDADWRWGKSEVKCDQAWAIPATTEDGLTGARQVARDVSALINGI